MNPSTALATVLVDELARNGVTDVVLCPGSRNAPLSMALHAADDDGRLRLHVRIDERTAGFLALGMARASGRPVAVATTSGTAVANLHPAVLEAHHGRVPLVVLSADRPPRLRDVGANQVVDQRGIFGAGALRFQHEFGVPARVSGQNATWRSMVCRALGAARGSAGDVGPVQLNLPLDVPLLPDTQRADGVDESWPESLHGRQGPWTRTPSYLAAADPVAAPRPDERCLFLADLTHPDAGRIAAAGYPVVSEAGGLAGAHVLSAGIALLGDRDFLHEHRPDRVIVLGRPTLYRAVSALLADGGITIDVVDNPVRYTDLAGIARQVSPTLAPIPDLVDDSAAGLFARRWRAADTAARIAIGRMVGRTAGGAAGGSVGGAAAVGSGSAASVVRTLGEALPSGTTLVVGSSQLPRDLGRFTAPRDGVRIVANRGVAGIDGTVSTAIGVALAGGVAAGTPAAGAAGTPAAGAPRTHHAHARTVALMGDLTFLHDITGLAIGPHEPRPDLTIVVVNNDGGGIFATLEPGEAAHAHAFERVFATPVVADIRSLTQGFGVPYVRASTTEEVAAVVADTGPGLRVVEVAVGRAGLRDEQQRLAQVVRSAVAGI